MRPKFPHPTTFEAARTLGRMIHEKGFEMLIRERDALIAEMQTDVTNQELGLMIDLLDEAAKTFLEKRQ